MPDAIRTYATLELSQATYDEIERKLLDAGYEHLFVRGPGSAIDMHGLTVTREQPQEQVTMRPHWDALPDGTPTYDGKPAYYCFGCDRMVTEACDKPDCLHAANDRVLRDLGVRP